MDKKEKTINNGLSIRNFTSEDIDYVINGHHKMYEAEYGLNTNVWKSYVADAVHDFVNKFDNRKDCLLILDYNGTTSGSAAIKQIDHKTAQFRFF